MPNSVFWALKILDHGFLNVFIFCLHGDCVELVHILACQLFSVCVPAIQDDGSVATSVELEWCFILCRTYLRIQLTFFSLILAYIYVTKRFVYIVYMKSFIPD